MRRCNKHAYYQSRLRSRIHLFPKNGEESVTALKEKFQSLIAQNAELGDIDEWGKRRLAYLINDEADGFYVLYNFSSGPELPMELDRVSQITDRRSPFADRAQREVRKGGVE